jgi:hypothetical protein
MTSQPNPFTGRVATIALLYLLGYLIASSLDLTTTALALRRSEVHEQNVFVTNAQVYASARAWAITLVGGLIMVACVVFARRNAWRVEEVWLRRPVRSFALFYLNPWSRNAIGRSPLHMLSFAIAFVAFRVLAAGNNTLIYLYGVAPIGAPIQWIARRTSPVFGFAVVIVVLFYALAIAASPLASRIVKSWQNAGA